MKQMKQMKQCITIGILFTFLNTFSQNSNPIKIGEQFPEFNLENINGTQTTLNSLKGEIVFINLWFTACAPCIDEMPALNDLKEEYKDKVKFIAITFDGNTQIEKFLSKREFNFEHLSNAGNFLRETLKNKNYPKNIILDREGKISYMNNGIPYTKDSKGEMIQLPYTFFKDPLDKVLAD